MRKRINSVLIFAMLVALLVLLGSTATLAQDDAQTAYRKVMELRQKGAPAEERVNAIETFLTKYGESRRASSAAFMAARIYIEELDQPAKGVALLESMRSKAKTEREKMNATQNLIWAYGRAGDINGLKAVAAEFAKSEDVNPSIYSSIGGAAMDAKDYAFAVKHLKKAAEGAKQKLDHAQNLNARGHYTWFLGRTLTELGESYLHLKQFADAEATFAKASKTGRKNVAGVYYNDHQLLWARTLNKQGKKEAAIERLLIPALMKQNPEAQKLLESLYREKHGAGADYEAFVHEQSKKLAVPAPDFKLTDYKGSSVSLSSLKGKVVMLNFWFPT